MRTLRLRQTRWLSRMGRILTHVTIVNALDPAREISCEALVDTGAWRLMLPRAWKERLGAFQMTRTVEMGTADQQVGSGAGQFEEGATPPAPGWLQDHLLPPAGDQDFTLVLEAVCLGKAHRLAAAAREQLRALAHVGPLLPGYLQYDAHQSHRRRRP